MKAAVIIPSRFGSSRFPGKPLAQIKGKTLIERVLDRVKLSKNVDFIAVATDDERIEEAVKSYKCNVFMTPQSCKSGTDRIAWTAENFLKDYDIFLNIQGDEPLINPDLIDKLAQELRNNKELEFITAAYPFENMEDAKDPNKVKVVFDKNRYALLFSRSLIPYNRDNENVIYYKHIGIYGYRRDFLIDFSKSAPSKLEKTESLEQLRALENGHKIKVVIADEDSIGVDTPEDIKRVEKLL